MPRISYILKIVLFCLLWTLFVVKRVHAQTAKDDNYLITDKHLKKSQSKVKKGTNTFVFKNVDGPYYYDDAKRKQILKADKAKDYAKMLPLMEEYISHFGCENF